MSTKRNLKTTKIYAGSLASHVTTFDPFPIHMAFSSRPQLWSSDSLKVVHSWGRFWGCWMMLEDGEGLQKVSKRLWTLNVWICLNPCHICGCFSLSLLWVLKRLWTYLVFCWISLVASFSLSLERRKWPIVQKPVYNAARPGILSEQKESLTDARELCSSVRKPGNHGSMWIWIYHPPKWIVQYQRTVYLCGYSTVFPSLEPEPQRIYTNARRSCSSEGQHVQSRTLEGVGDAAEEKVTPVVVCIQRIDAMIAPKAVSVFLFKSADILLDSWSQNIHHLHGKEDFSSRGAFPKIERRLIFVWHRPKNRWGSLQPLWNSDSGSVAAQFLSEAARRRDFASQSLCLWTQ